MYIAMNRFRIALGREDDFETLWRERDSYLEGEPGFRSFHLLKGKFLQNRARPRRGYRAHVLRVISEG